PGAGGRTEDPLLGEGAAGLLSGVPGAALGRRCAARRVADRVYSRGRTRVGRMAMDDTLKNLAESLRLHRAYLEGRTGGVRLLKSGLTLANLKVSNLNFSEATLLGLSAVGCSLVGCQFQKTDLFAADFSESDLTGSRFNKADLRGARLVKAVLRQTEFVD